MFNKAVLMILVFASISGCETEKYSPSVKVKETHLKYQGRNYVYCDNCLYTNKRS